MQKVTMQLKKFAISLSKSSFSEENTNMSLLKAGVNFTEISETRIAI